MLRTYDVLQVEPTIWEDQHVFQNRQSPPCRLEAPLASRQVFSHGKISSKVVSSENKIFLLCVFVLVFFSAWCLKGSTQSFLQVFL